MVEVFRRPLKDQEEEQNTEQGVLNLGRSVEKAIKSTFYKQDGTIKTKEELTESDYKKIDEINLLWLNFWALAKGYSNNREVKELSENLNNEIGKIQKAVFGFEATYDDTKLKSPTPGISKEELASLIIDNTKKICGDLHIEEGQIKSAFSVFEEHFKLPSNSFAGIGKQQIEENKEDNKVANNHVEQEKSKQKESEAENEAEKLKKELAIAQKIKDIGERIRSATNLVALAGLFSWLAVIFVDYSPYLVVHFAEVYAVITTVWAIAGRLIARFGASEEKRAEGKIGKIIEQQRLEKQLEELKQTQKKEEIKQGKESETQEEKEWGFVKKVAAVGSGLMGLFLGLGLASSYYVTLGYSSMWLLLFQDISLLAIPFTAGFMAGALASPIRRGEKSKQEEQQKEQPFQHENLKRN